MRASLIIAAHNEGESLWQTIRAAVESIGALDYEIVVVDDASDDDSVAQAVQRFPNVRTFRYDQRQGTSPAKNRGAREARGDALVFLDGHCNPESGSIERLVNDIERTDGQAIITPAIPGLNVDAWKNCNVQIGHGYRVQLDTMECGWVPLSSLHKARLRARDFYESPAAIGCAVAMHRALYDKLRGFDPHMRVWGVEDMDLSIKCWLLGHSILHDPVVRIGHRFRRQFDTYDVPIECVVVNKLRMAYKNFTPSVWAEWLDRNRQSYAGRLSDHPEGLWAHPWKLFESQRGSADEERTYLFARRKRDEFWYANYFAISWPRLEHSAWDAPSDDSGFALQASAEPSPSPAPVPCPDKCNEANFDPAEEGFDDWNNTDEHGWELTEDVTETNKETGKVETFDLLRTPVGQRTLEVPFEEYVVTEDEYGNGFIIEIEFRFDPEQKPLFPPNSAPHRHRPTFLGNSGIGIYSSEDKDGVSRVLYEVQITDCNRMCPPESNKLWHQNGFLRMDFTKDWKPDSGDELGTHLTVPEALLEQDRRHVDPEKATDFVSHLTVDPGGGADCLCAVVAGLPVSIFEDVYIQREINEIVERFPRNAEFAQTWPVGSRRNVVSDEANEKPGGKIGKVNLPIGGTEEPHEMNWKHRADFVPCSAGDSVHYNKQDSAFWNKLWICFIPPVYNANSLIAEKKIENACLITRVNGKEVFNGQIKTGTRSMRNTSEQHPEQKLFLDGVGDKKIRIHGHWGSTVEFRNVVIRPRKDT